MHQLQRQVPTIIDITTSSPTRSMPTRLSHAWENCYKTEKQRKWKTSVRMCTNIPTTHLCKMNGRNVSECDRKYVAKSKCYCCCFVFTFCVGCVSNALPRDRRGHEEGSWKRHGTVEKTSKDAGGQRRTPKHIEVHYFSCRRQV